MKRLLLSILILSLISFSACSLNTKIPIVDSNLFEYSITKDGTYSIVKYIGGMLLHCGIPDDYQGVAITEIDEGVFKDNRDIIDLSIPKSIRSIGSYAFSNCKNLKKVVFNKGLSKIDSYAFSDCKSLKR